MLAAAEVTRLKHFDLPVDKATEVRASLRRLLLFGKASRLGCLFLIALLALAVSRAPGADRTWDGGGGNNNWSTIFNWDGDVTAPSANDRLFFGGATRPGPVNNFAVDTVFDALTFNSGAGSFTLSGNAVTLNGGITNNESANAQTISLGLVLSTFSDIEVVSGGVLTISGIISGPVLGLTKYGTGTLRFTAVNTYGGDTRINAGAISVDGNATLGNGTGALNFSGGSLYITANRAVGDPVANPIILTTDATIAAAGGGGFTTTRNVNFTNSFSGSAGTVTIRNIDGTTADSVFAVRLSGGGFTFSRPIVLGQGGDIGAVQLNFFNTSGAGSQTFGGVISGPGSVSRSVTSGGTGGDTIFNAANTYSGGTTLNNGGIGFGISSTGSPVTSGPIGTGPLTISGGLFSSQTVFASGGARVVGNAIIFTGSQSQLTIGGANDLTLSGTIDLGSATRTIKVDNTAASILSGVISGTGGLIKTNGGTLTFSGANTYTGGTTLGQGTLKLGDNNVIPDSGNFTFAGGILEANNKTDTLGPLSLTADSTLNLGNDGSRQDLTFASANAYVGGTLTVTGWGGPDGSTYDRFIITADPGSSGILGHIQFDGYALGATWISGTGEVVPVPEPINVALAVFGVSFVGFSIVRRVRTRRRIVES